MSQISARMIASVARQVAKTAPQVTFPRNCLTKFNVFLGSFVHNRHLQIFEKMCSRFSIDPLGMVMVTRDILLLSVAYGNG